MPHPSARPISSLLTGLALPTLLVVAGGCRHLESNRSAPPQHADVPSVTPIPQVPVAVANPWRGLDAVRGDWAVFQVSAEEARAATSIGAAPATAATPPLLEPTAAAAAAPWWLLIVDRRDAAMQRIVEVRSATAQPNWQSWIDNGYPGAASVMVYEIDLATGLVPRILDSITQRWDGPYENLRAPFSYPGTQIDGGRGAFPPVDLPDAWRADEPVAWLGFVGEETTIDAKGNPTNATTGYGLWATAALSFAELAGVRSQDTVIAIGPMDYNHLAFKDFRTSIDNRFRVGDNVTVTWLHPAGDHLELHRGTAVVPEYPLPRLEPDAAAARYIADWQGRADLPERRLVERLTAAPELAAQRDDLYFRLARLNRKIDAYRLPAVMAIHAQPWVAEPLSRDLVNTLPSVGPTRLDNQLRWLDRVFLTDSEAAPLEAGGSTPAVSDPAPAATPSTPASSTSPTLPDWHSGDLKAHLDYIEAILLAAAAEQTRAFAGFSDAERALILASGSPLMDGFVNTHMMIYDANSPRQNANVQLLRIASKLDRAALIRQARLAARLTADDFLASLRTAMTAADKPGVATIATRDTAVGRIVLQGSDDDRYTDKGNNPAFLADLAGNDYYANNCASNMPDAKPMVPTSVFVDFAGNDRYESWADGVMGCGYMGAGLLLDMAGNDVYDARRLAMGAGYFGIGVLEDRGGDDEYRAIDFAMGVGQFGAGILLDDGGNNRFQTHTASQGVGLTWGVGLLHVTGSTGRDLYLNKGQHVSGYGDAGSWEGWGQGFGTGHRNYASGGLGLLVDDGGDDRYDGGTFSQGGGYYFGMGILDDRAGADEYRGSRYNKGFTAHQAVGVFLDDAGDDRHWQSHHVASGMSWDESVTLFVNQRGDDLYDAPGFAFGAAAMNGFTLFIDRDGKDLYKGARPGDVHGNQYHSGASLGIALDLGSGDDVFSGGRTANTSVVDKDIAVFVDAPTIDAATQRAAEAEAAARATASGAANAAVTPPVAAP